MRLRSTIPGLDAFDAVIVGGLDRLSTADVHALDRFMRERGGAVVLVAGSTLRGRRCARSVVGLRISLNALLEQPTKLTGTPPAASLRASELLVMGAADQARR